MANQQDDTTPTRRSDPAFDSASSNLDPAGKPNVVRPNKLDTKPIAANTKLTPTPAPRPGTQTPSGEDIRTAAGGIYDQVKETASGAYDAVATKATSQIEEHKGELSTGLKTLADSFRKTGTELRSADQPNQLTDLTAKYSGTAANKIEQVANYFERKDLRAVMRDAEGFARRNPAIFLGAAFALGMVAARFLKSSPPDRFSDRQPGSLNTGTPAALPTGNQPTGTMPPRG